VYNRGNNLRVGYIWDSIGFTASKFTSKLNIFAIFFSLFPYFLFCLLITSGNGGGFDVLGAVGSRQRRSHPGLVSFGPDWTYKILSVS